MKEGMLMIVKFFLFLLLLPLIIASVFAFQAQAFGIPAHKEGWFLWGAAVFVLVYLFVYNFKEVYAFGQTIVANLLKVLGPVSASLGLIIPIYTILITCVYLIVNLFGYIPKYQGWLFFALGFSIAMHIVSTAHQLYNADKGSLKGEYFFSFGWILVFDLCLFALLLGCLVPEFSFVGFLKTMSHHTIAHYQKIYHVLFSAS